MPTITERFRNSWNAFFNARDPDFTNLGVSTSIRPDRVRLGFGNERSIVNAIYNRIALDASSVDIMHAKVDDENRFVEECNSEFNNCLRLEPNLDQTAKAFFQDVVMSMFDEGCVGILPTDTTENPNRTNSYDILAMRTASIVQWFPTDVRVKVYNERTGQKEELTIPKTHIAIVENPFYSIMNSPNSTLKRLIRKLTLLDAVDEQNGAGKLDLIIQLPYVIKTESRKNQAEQRRKDIEMQLASSKYGIAYTDGTEHITQLNRSVDNQLLNQVEYLTNLLMSQLGITAEILNGTASPEVMNNYYSRTIEPILTAIIDEMKRKFLTKTARTRGQSIVYFRDPFKLIPINNLAELADKMTRNEIMTSNELRAVAGLKPSKDPSADELRNKNLNQPAEAALANQQIMEDEEIQNEEEMSQSEFDSMMNDLDSLDAQLDDLEKELK